MIIRRKGLKTHLKLGHSGPGQRQASGTNQLIKALGQDYH